MAIPPRILKVSLRNIYLVDLYKNNEFFWNLIYRKPKTLQKTQVSCIDIAEGSNDQFEPLIKKTDFFVDAN